MVKVVVSRANFEALEAVLNPRQLIIIINEMGMAMQMAERPALLAEV